MQMLEQVDKQKSWGVKSKKGHYIGTSLEHYHYYYGWFADTGGKRGSETVVFKHKYITCPTTTPADAIVHAAKLLTAALRGNVPPPLVSSGIDHLKELTNIFDTTAAAYDKDDEENDPPTAHAPRVSMETPPTSCAQRTAVQHPRVNQDTAPAPRVGIIDPPINAAPEAAHATTAKPSSLPAWFPNYITQDDDDTPPAQNTRSRAVTRSITDEAMLSCLEMSTHRLSAKATASRKYPLAVLCELAGSVLDATTGDLLEYRHLIRHPLYKVVWRKAHGKEIGRLAQGIPGIVVGTDTLDFIYKSEIPANRFRDCTYATIVCNERPEKEDPNRLRIVVGGDRVHYPGDCGTPTADIITVKLLLNSVISTKDAKFMTMDISNFYLMTPLERKEYLRMKLADFSEEVIEHYNL